MLILSDDEDGKFGVRDQGTSSAGCNLVIKLRVLCSAAAFQIGGSANLFWDGRCESVRQAT